MIEIPEDRCPSCAAERRGTFCHDCGQRFPTGRLTLRGLWRELPARAFNLDRGLLHTFLDLWRRPGRAARDFVEGRRSPYVMPLTYFLVAAAINLLGLALVEADFRAQMEERAEGNPVLIKRLAGSFGEEEAAARFAEIYFNLIRQGYTYLFLFFMTMPFSVYLKLLAGRLAPRFNLAEMAIFALYTTGHMVLVTGLIVPFTGRIGLEVHGAVSMSFYFVYTAFAARGFFDRGRWRVVPTLLALAAGLATFLVLLIITFLIVLTRQAG